VRVYLETLADKGLLANADLIGMIQGAKIERPESNDADTKAE